MSLLAADTGALRFSHSAKVTGERRWQRGVVISSDRISYLDDLCHNACYQLKANTSVWGLMVSGVGVAM